MLLFEIVKMPPKIECVSRRCRREVVSSQNIALKSGILISLGFRNMLFPDEKPISFNVCFSLVAICFRLAKQVFLSRRPLLAHA